MKNDLGYTCSVYHWTRTAIECYERGCVCHKCPVQNILSQKCKMKVSVLELVKKFGKPSNKTAQN